MKLEDFEEINDAIYCARNSTKVLGICIMRLSELKETTSHGLRWNNSPVSPAVLFFFFLGGGGVCRGLLFNLYASMRQRLIKFSGKTHVQHNSKAMR